MTIVGNTDTPVRAGVALELVHLDDICQTVLSSAGDAVCTKGLHVSLAVDDGFTEVALFADEVRRVLGTMLRLCVRLAPHRGGLSLDACLDRASGATRFALSTAFSTHLDARAHRELASARARIAELRGGLFVEHRPDRSLTLHVHAPYGASNPHWLDESASLGPPPSRPRGAGAGTSILLIDDDEVSAALVREYLAMRGFDVRVAYDGWEGVTRARAEVPALILMDVQMPGIDGLTATRMVRADADRTLRRVPIVAMTALAMPADRERCIAAGADAYIAKPVVLRRLLAMIEEHIDTRLVRTT